MDKKQSLEILRKIKENLKKLSEEEREERNLAFWDNLSSEILSFEVEKGTIQIKYKENQSNTCQIETDMYVA